MADSVHLRPLYYYASPGLGTTRRVHRKHSRIAVATLAAVAVLAGASFVACGGDDDDDSATTPAASDQTVATAAELVADIPKLGYKEVTDGKAAGFAETATSRVALFENPASKVSSLRLEVSIFANLETATTNFGTLAEALKNPPPDLFGANTKQTAGTPAYQADQSRSYRTDKPDNQGTYVWSDIHRFGRAVVIVYTIGPDIPETANVRKQVAEQLAAKAPR